MISRNDFEIKCIKAVKKLLSEKGISIPVDDIQFLRTTVSSPISTALIFTGIKEGFYYELNYNEKTKEMAYEEVSTTRELKPTDFNYLIYRSLLNNANTEIA